jgi:hypothetical protein
MLGGKAMIDMNSRVDGIVLTKVCSIKPNKDSVKSKQVTLRVKYEGILQDVFDASLSPTVIKWQNGPGRSKWAEWNQNQVIEISFKHAGARPQVDPETAMVLKLQSMTPEEQIAYLQKLAKKANPVPIAEEPTEEPTEEELEDEE